MDKPEPSPAASHEESPKRNPASFELVATIVKILDPLTADEQRHILQTVATWLHLDEFRSTSSSHLSIRSPSSPKEQPSLAPDYPFSGRREISPKEFLLEKDPKTDGERITCLGYYLTHYREQPYFKTEDLSKLNTEAAQRKFANAAFAAKNAVRDGYFVHAPKKGLRQLSAIGEQFVQALPDREAARLVKKRMLAHKWRSPGRKIDLPEEPAEEET